MDVSLSKTKRIAIVSKILPETNYSAYLAGALQKTAGSKLEVLVYADKNRQNLKAPMKNIKLVWSQNILFPFHVLRQAKKDHLDLIHLQHEINMFGGLSTALVFPLLPILLKIFNLKTIITIHAVVKQKEVDSRFLETFAFPQSPLLVLPVKFFFFFLYYICGKFSDRIIVHSPGLRQIMIKDYFVNPQKIEVILEGVPEYSPKYKKMVLTNSWIDRIKNKPFILYFGYLVRRKRLEDLIDAFKNISSEYPNHLLVMAGGCLQKDYEESIKKRAEDCPAIIFTSHICDKELGWLLEKCLFTVVPATYSISASGPLSHIMRFKKPVIVPKLGVLQEEITDGVEGLYYQPNDSVSLTRALRKLVEDNELREKLSRNMQKKSASRTWSKIAQKTIYLYEDLM